MKTVILNCCKQVALVLSLFLPAAIKAAPDYTFTAAALQSGTDLQVGAVYRFTAVKPGVDALVTITFITAGCAVTKIDNDGAGYSSAFQPEILVPSKTTGYAEFNIRFVTTGTSTSLVMVEIPATAIDVDGNNTLWGGALNEYDEISRGASSYVDYGMLGGQITVTTPAGWMRAVNTAGVEYGGISTSATAVMVTTVNANTSFFNYRTGSNNQSNIDNLPRQKSLYFGKFSYPSSVLAGNDVLAFKGAAQKGRVDLTWQLSNNAARQSVVLERSANGRNFADLHVFSMDKISEAFSWQDTIAMPEAFYRLKLTYTNGAMAYSRILPFKNLLQEKAAMLNIYPAFIRSAATVSFTSGESGSIMFCIINRQGQTVIRKALQASQGKNIFAVSIDKSLPAGMYAAVVYANGTVYSQQVMVQQ